MFVLIIVELGIYIFGILSIKNNMLYWDLLMVNDVGDFLEGWELSFNLGGVVLMSWVM